MAEDRLTVLYNWSDAMSSAGDKVKEKHEDTYKSIIEYVKTSTDTKERVLAAQIISRFFKHFPDHENIAFDSIVDLCESADVNVRKHATMIMIAICRDCKQVVPKAADILIQLYQTDDNSEVNLISQSLSTLLRLDIEKFLKSFFTNFEDGSEVVRERALKFLVAKIPTVENALTREIEEQLMNYGKKAMEDVTKDEFISFIGLLSKLKISKTSSGQSTIVSAIKAQAELDKDYDVKDKDALDKFLLCTLQTIPFLSQYNRGSEYVNYICMKILPQLEELKSSGSDLIVLQVLAEMSPHLHADDVPNLIDLEACAKSLFNQLLKYLPQAPDVSIVDKPAKLEGTKPKDAEPDQEQKQDNANDAEPEKAVANESDKAPESNEVAASKQTETVKTISSPDKDTNKSQNNQETDFQFTHIECLMYAFGQMCRLKPELYTESMQAECRMQLAHLANGCKKYSNALETQLAKVRKQDLQNGENKLRSVALKTTKNISSMILDMFKKQSDFKRTQQIDISHLHTRVRHSRDNNGSNTTAATPQPNKRLKTA